MAVAEFPLPSVSSSYPTPLYFEMDVEDFGDGVGTTIYDDETADYRRQNGGAGIKRWTIKYDGLSAAEAAILDAHVATAIYSSSKGSAFGFNFRDRDTTTLYAAVHYAPGGYKKSHTKTWSCAREIVLEKRG